MESSQARHERFGIPSPAVRLPSVRRSLTAMSGPTRQMNRTKLSSSSSLYSSLNSSSRHTKKPSPPLAATMPMPAPVPELMDDLLIEIFLRLPPDEPECLVRAAAVCKPWRNLISDSAFLRRYREFHRVPPMLGFLHNNFESSRAHFAAFTQFRPLLDHTVRSCNVLDCRHGRVLLHDGNSKTLLLWDPMTGEKKCICEPGMRREYFNAAVLCGMAGCDHLDCHGGPFLVAFIGSNDCTWVVQAYLYSSENNAWSAPSSLQHDNYMDISRPPVLMGEALYFISTSDDSILRYDLDSDRDLSVIVQPAYYRNGISLLPAEDGGMWFVGLNEFILHLWSTETDPDGNEVWIRRKISQLNVLPIGDLYHRPYLIASAKGPDSDIIFVSIDAGVFMIDMETELATKVFKKGDFDTIFPYMSFCTPVRRRGVTAGEQGAAADNNMSSIHLEDGVKALCLEAS